MFNNSEAYMNSIANTFTKEPEFKCPACGTDLYTDWVDNGFGPYSVQASPYGCECGWHESGCKECIKERCFSWERCQGRAVIKVTPAGGQSGINHMVDPNVKSEEAQGAEQAAVAENEANEQESAEQSGTE